MFTSISTLSPLNQLALAYALLAVAQLAYGVVSWAGPEHSRIVAVAGRCRSTCEDEEAAQMDYWNALGMPLLKRP
jgi:hypothetical protein